MKDILSMPVDSRILILNSLGADDDLLLLYSDKLERKTRSQIYQEFFRNGIKKGELCLHFFDEENSKLNLDHVFNFEIDHNHLRLVPLKISHLKCVRMQSRVGFEEPDARSIEPEDDGEAPVCEDDYSKEEEIQKSNYDTIQEKLQEAKNLVKKGTFKGLRVILDYGKIVNSVNIAVYLKVEQDLKKLKEKIEVVKVSAHNLSSLDHDSANAMMKMHNKLIITGENEQTVITPTFTLGDWEPERSRKLSLDMVSQETIEHFVKKSLNIIILSILQEKPMCGYDLIKAIFQQFHVLLSQGTVYPLLYTMKEEGLLKTSVQGNTRMRVYTPTVEGRPIIESKLNEFIRSQEYLMNVINTYQKRIPRAAAPGDGAEEADE